MAPKLNIVQVSTRPGRAGSPVAKWFHDFVKQDGQFEPVLIDLADLNLPIFDEPNHPRAKKYEHAHTKKWSTLIDAGEAVVFVTPEYDFFAPPSLTNAIIYLWQEWNYKPVGFVSYGGMSGGLRSVESVKGLLAGLRTVPIPEGVAIPAFQQFINDEGEFQANELVVTSANTMIGELLKWSNALKPLRAS
ncbi:NADPH-dependent FMN reductase [Phyllobacterium sp. TAF24]|uniref:NADPH-dependent FMN reductase n=1 Tax=Phyllobacterium sp. TAF24 TaxID=3233068 RepID=UPI003F95EEA6